MKTSFVITFKTTYKKIGLFFIVVMYTISAQSGKIIISGVFDGPLSGGTPKGVELFVRENVTDLDDYALGSANNGGGTDGAEFTGMDGSASAGSYIYVANEGSNDGSFTTFFGFAPDYEHSAMSINGDDAIELFYTADDGSSWTVIDLYGDINTDGNGEDWEYLDSWAKSKPTRATATTFSSSNWIYGSPNALDGESTNALASTPFPIKGVPITGDSGFRMMSSPKSGTIFSDLLAELWTQGMTGADVTDGTANVWTLSGQSFSALTNLSSASLTAGQGFLVYVYADIDWDGDSDLPVNLHITGAYNNASATVPSSGSIANGEYGLAGNPYATTIDFDNITLTNIAVTTSVWDDANSDWKTWNKTSQGGDLSGGLIAPYQGFWIEGDGGSGTITIETADKSTSAGTFYRTLDDDNRGRMVFNALSDGHSSSNYLSFYEGGTLGVDDGESELLLPFQASSRLVMMSVVDGDAHKISSYPYDHEGSVSVPFDVMRLTLDETNYVTDASEVTLNWDIEELPDHINMTLTDNITGSETYLDYESEYVFTTEPKGSFSANYDGPIGTYPVVGEPRFTLSVSYGALSQNEDATLPSDFALHPVYPNPFNPSATISFDIPDVSSVALNVYDVKGALVETLLQDHMKPGKHHYNWEPQGLPSGVYFMKLTTANKSFTQKVTYIK
jgi:hypothetical protein